MAERAASQWREIDLHMSVAYLLASVTAEKLRGKQAAVHQAFYEAAKQFPDLLPGIAFSRDPSAPYSKALERVLFCLVSSRLLSLSNPSFEEMEMTKAIKGRIKTRYGPQLKDKTQELEEAAKVVEEALRLGNLKSAA